MQVSETLSGEQNRRTLKCASADLSRGGLRLTVAEALPVGALLELWIKLAGACRGILTTKSESRSKMHPPPIVRLGAGCISCERR